MKIIKTPWKKEFLELVSNSKSSIKITSPFLKENICNDIIKVKQTKSKIELITKFNLNNAYRGSLDLSAIENIINSSGKVSNYSKLHSKIYLFDDKKAVITSANLTNGGLLNNYEYGVYLDDKAVISNIVSDFNLISSNENTGVIKIEHINKAREILSNILQSNQIVIPKVDIDNREEDIDIIDAPTQIIKNSLTGWKKEVFNCLVQIPEQKFNLNRAYAFKNDLKQKYPSNNNVKDKIRQILQDLRDLGLIEFLGNGEYKKLWR